MDIGKVFIAIEAIHFAAAMLLAGGLLFCFYAGPASGVEAAFPRWLLRWTAAIALLSGIIWLALEGAQMGNGWSDATDPSTLDAVLTSTLFGEVWRWRMVLAIAIAFASWLPPRTGRDRLLCAMAILFLSSLALTGHAIMREGWLGMAQIVNQSLHLATAGFWLGGLPLLLLALRKTGNNAAKVAILSRFSIVGLITVPILLLTGLLNAILQMGSFAGFGTPYGEVLAVKLCLVFGMLALAGLNRLIFLPRASILHEAAGVLGMIRWTAIAEIVLGLAVLTAASLLGSLQPPFLG